MEIETLGNGAHQGYKARCMAYSLHLYGVIAIKITC